MLSLLYGPTLKSVHDTGKNIALTICTFVFDKVISLLFNILSRFVIVFLPFSFMAAVSVSIDFGAQESTICHCFHFFFFICYKVMELEIMILVFWMLSFKPGFSFSSLILIKRLLVLLPFLPLEWYHLNFWSCWYFSWQSSFQLVIHPVPHFTWRTLHVSYISKVDNIQPCCTYLPVLKQSVVPCPVLTVASWATYRFLRR